VFLPSVIKEKDMTKETFLLIVSMMLAAAFLCVMSYYESNGVIVSVNK